TAMSSMVARVSASRMTVSSLSDDREVLTRAGQRARAAGRDLDGVLDLHAAPAVLVVRRLHAEDHAGLERGARRGVDGRRVVGLEPDAMADVVTLVVWQPVLAGDAHGDIEEVAYRHAGFHGRDGGSLAGEDRRVVARLLVGRLAEHGGARDVRPIGADEA